MPRVAAMLVFGAWACSAAAVEPVSFDGFGIDAFTDSASVAAALREIDIEAATKNAPLLGLAVHGPAGRDQQLLPLAAEVRSRLQGLDVAAGLLADPDVVREGPLRWTGRVGLVFDHAAGRESLEFRTVVGRNGEAGLLGVELGPRLERRIEDGVTIFLDGKAEAQAMRSPETGWWTLPGTEGSGGAVGVAARTGLTW